MSPAGGMPYPPGALPGAGGRMAGAPPGGARPTPPQPPGGVPPIRGRSDSIMNPMDGLRHAARGRIRPDMSVREALEVMGVDLEGPITQLQSTTRNMVQNATMEGKIRGAGAPGGAPGGVPGGAPRAPSPGSAPPMGGAPGQGGISSLLGGRAR